MFFVWCRCCNVTHLYCYWIVGIHTYCYCCFCFNESNARALRSHCTHVPLYSHTMYNYHSFIFIAALWIELEIDAHLLDLSLSCADVGCFGTAASGLLLQNLFKHKKFTLSLSSSLLLAVCFISHSNTYCVCAFITSFV